MKLRGKITLIVALFVFALVSLISSVAFISQTNTIDDMTETNLVELAKSNSLSVSNQFAVFEKIVGVVGKNQQLYSDMLSNEQKAALMDGMAQSFGFTSGNVLDANGVSIVDGTDFSEREYVQRALKGEINVSSVSLSKLTNKYGCSVAGPLINDAGEIVGVVYFRLDIDFLLNITSQISISDNSNAYIIDQTGMVIVHDNQELINNLSATDIGDFADSLTDIAENRSGSVEYTFDDVETEAGYCVIDNTDGWVLVVSAPESDFTASTDKLTRVLIGLEVLGVVAGAIGAFIMGTYIASPIKKIKNVLVKISEGDFSGQMQTTRKKDEIGQLINATSSLQTSITSLFNEANSILGSMAEYDLTSDDMKVYPGEFNSMSESVNGIKMILNSMIKNVQEAISNVGVGAGEIADATTALSEGTVAQASSIHQAVNSIENVAAQTERNSENGNLVNDKLHKLDELIKRSNEQMSELRGAVIEVEEMSEDILKIVSDIDSISFQTNILALNASVEAARAGENGKGFAVVADEVGNLANKSGDSSKKTSELIEKCIDSINKAKKCADRTFDSLHQIVESSDEISHAFEEITVSTVEQAENTQLLKGEINKISDVVQTNTATAEETAASTQVLSGEAENLNNLIRKFKV